MNIVLTGFMGTGKTSVGKLLAERLGWRSVDLDALVERRTGMKVSEIFARHGEPYFRDRETEAAREAGALDRVVIACGGGAVLRTGNMEALERNGIIVCLTASPERILERAGKDTGRPLLQVSDPLVRIRELLEARKPFYGRCHAAVDTGEMSVEDVVEKILGEQQVRQVL